MLTYYVRHTEKLGIDDETLERLRLSNRVAIHYPNYAASPDWRSRDNSSFDPNKYPKGKGHKEMKILAELAAEGGYVCAQFRDRDGCLVGEVPPNTPLELFKGRWDDMYEGCLGRRAILKALKLRKPKWLEPNECARLLLGRPKQGAISRWRKPKNMVAAIVDGKRVRATLGSLLYSQQEVMVSEFLRTPASCVADLPTVAYYLASPGRTMKDIDLYGMTEAGEKVFVQVTFSKIAQCTDKICSLEKYRGRRTKLLFFCNCDSPHQNGRITMYPLQQVYKLFGSTPVGKAWLRNALGGSK